MTSWCFISPFVVFQALLSVRDAGLTAAVSVGDVLSPILLLLGVLCLVSLVVSIRYRTAFQVRLYVMCTCLY
jgi:hypothetical protein